MREFHFWFIYERASTLQWLAAHFVALFRKNEILADANHSFMNPEITEKEIAEAENSGDYSGLLHKLKNYLQTFYQPCQKPQEADFHFTTLEIYFQLQKVLPTESIYSPSDVAIWLHDLGFSFYDYGNFKFEWMVKRASNVL